MAKTYEDIKIGVNTFATATEILNVVGKAGLQQVSKEKGIELLAQTMVPAIALKAFSCELALKALIAKAEKNVDREHKLNILFSRMDDADQNSISQKVINKIKEQIPTYNQAQFEQDLQDDAKTFVDWRYFYEKPLTVNMTFLDTLYGVLIAYIKEIK